MSAAAYMAVTIAIVQIICFIAQIICMIRDKVAFSYLLYAVVALLGFANIVIYVIA